ncbi:TPA: hypothetical protein KC497_005274 [Escherichia coli O146]|nr:hypothetical protein [Escherichia coli O146]
MSELSSRPAREPVVYTLEQVSTIPEKQWHAFVVTNGAIVIHTQRLKSDPGGNLLS